MAHSLGSVLSYDILCNQPHLYASLDTLKTSQPSPEAAQRSKRARMTQAGLLKSSAPFEGQGF